jgi:uncharacterized protein (DUF849 family)
MIVQACINGARPDDYHPQLPLTAEAIAIDAPACVSAGAAELHIHPRGPDGRESLSSVDEMMHAVRERKNVLVAGGHLDRQDHAGQRSPRRGRQDRRPRRADRG